MTSTRKITNAYSGGVIGYGQYVNITNVHADINIKINPVDGTWQYVGGIVGYVNYASLINCSMQAILAVGLRWWYSSNVNNLPFLAVLIREKFLPAVQGQQVSSHLWVQAAQSQPISGYIAADSNNAGGVVGLCGNATVKNCFNVGLVRETPERTQGAVIGTLNNVNGVTENLYYLEGTAEKGIGSVKDEATQFATAVTAETLASDDFVTINSGLESAAFKRVGLIPFDLAGRCCSRSEPTYGDIDGNGTVSSQDVIVLLPCLNGNELTDEQFEAADVNKDGVVNTTDVTLILQYINGVITHLPVGD